MISFGFSEVTTPHQSALMMFGFMILRITVGHAHLGKIEALLKTKR